MVNTVTHFYGYARQITKYKGINPYLTQIIYESFVKNTNNINIYKIVTENIHEHIRLFKESIVLHNQKISENILKLQT